MSENPPSDVLADCLASIANQIMRHLYELSGNRLDLMLSVSNLINHRCEMLYRTGYIRNYEQAMKEEEPQCPTNQ